MGFQTFLGNPAAVATLREMLRSDRLPGAMLFTGPEGTGKKTLAKMVAKAAVCERLKDDFCDDCRRCRRAGEMLSGAEEDLERRRALKEASRRTEGLVYFDIQLIAPITRYVLVDQIRMVRHIAYTQPFELPRRIFIIDQAQAIHWQAVDLLLKVMEEPPPTTTFILVCPNAGELRATIRSRCQRVAFAPVDEAVIGEFLAAEGRVPAADRPLIARLARGSVGRALAFDPQAYLARREPWLRFFDALGRASAGRPPTPDWARLFDATRNMTADREHYDETLAVGFALLRDLLLVLERGDGAAIHHPDLAPRLKAWAARLGFGGIEMLKNGLDEAYRLQVRNVNQQLSLDALTVGLAEKSRSASY